MRLCLFKLINQHHIDMTHTSNWPRYQPVKGVDVNFFKTKSKPKTKGSNITEPKTRRKK